MADIMTRLGSTVLVIQGIMDEALQRQGFAEPLCTLNITEPESIADQHRLYRIAGADCAITNTAHATSAELAKWGFEAEVGHINAQGVSIARNEEFPHVLARIASCGLAIEPNSGVSALEALYNTEQSDGPAPEDTSDQNAETSVGLSAAIEQYAEQAAALASAGPDALLLLGFTQVDDLAAALIACHKVCDLPVFASITLRDTTDFTGAIAIAQGLANAHVAAIGCNGASIDDEAAFLTELHAKIGLPLFAIPDIAFDGQDASQDAQQLTDIQRRLASERAADTFAHDSIKLLKAGACAIGSAKGSTPSATGALFATIGGLELA